MTTDDAPAHSPVPSRASASRPAGSAPVRRRLALVTLVVPDYDEAIAFFTDVLDFSLREDTALGDGKRWVIVAPGSGEGDGALLLARAATPRQSAAIGEQTGGRVGFFLETSNFEADHARFAGRGLVFVEAPRVEPYGIVAKFTDPFGNLWDLIERR